MGNFVELKNTDFGPGAKAHHLAYLGDASIGEAVNIGAGTITCNYDGIRKHRTNVGKNAFVGSNSTLVAPAEIGEGSLRGSGVGDYRAGTGGIAGAGARPPGSQRGLGSEEAQERTDERGPASGTLFRIVLGVGPHDDGECYVALLPRGHSAP